MVVAVEQSPTYTGHLPRLALLIEEGRDHQPARAWPYGQLDAVDAVAGPAHPARRIRRRADVSRSGPRAALVHALEQPELGAPRARDAEVVENVHHLRGHLPERQEQRPGTAVLDEGAGTAMARRIRVEHLLPGPGPAAVLAPRQQDVFGRATVARRVMAPLAHRNRGALGGDDQAGNMHPKAVEVVELLIRMVHDDPRLCQPSLLLARRVGGGERM